MKTWRENFEAFAASQRDPDLDFYHARLDYEAYVLPLHSDHDRVSAKVRTSRETAFRNLWIERRSTQRNARFLLPAYAVMLLRNPANWQRFGEALAPTPGLITALEGALGSDPAGAENPYWLVLHGLLAHIRQKDEAACRFLHQAARMPSFSETIPCSLRGAALSKPLPDFQTLRATQNTLSENPVRQERKDARVSDLPYLSFCGDPVYFEAFALAIVDSLTASGAKAMNLHFHVVRSHADDDGASAVMDDLAARCQAAGYSLAATSEHQSGADRTYFASARFLRAKDLLQLLDHAILMSDMDVAFTRDPSRDIMAYSRDHVSIMPSHGPYWGFLPWRRFWAGHVLLPATPQGHDFADLLQRSICYLWREEKNLTWWVDQYALWLAARTMTAMDYGPFLQPIRQSSYMTSGEDFKIEGLKRVKAIGERMAQGDHWHMAVTTTQEQRAEPPAALS